MGQFKVHATQRKVAFPLADVKQGAGETLKSYHGRFNDNIAKVKGFYESLILMATLAGVDKQTE